MRKRTCPTRAEKEAAKAISALLLSLVSISDRHSLLGGAKRTCSLLETRVIMWNTSWLKSAMHREGNAPAVGAVRNAGRERSTRGGAGLCAAVAVLVLLLSATSAQAQQGAAVLTGTITDAATGKPVIDAVVTVTSPSLQGEELTVTDDAGAYRIPGLPPGTYVLRVEKESFRPYARAGLDLHADTTIRLNGSLLPESLKAQEVVVVGRTPTVDVGSSSTGMNITSDFTSRIPLAPPGIKGAANRSFESVADVIPGAQPDAFGVSIFGTTSFENRYLLDGLSVSNSTYGSLGTPLSIEFIKEISVLSGGYMPEYGRATGGILNAITKSGSNEFHGSAWFNVAPGALEGTRKTAYRDQDSIVTRRKLRHMGDVGADLGGPLVKDKLWFYTGFDLAQTNYAVKRSIRRYLYDKMDQPVLVDGEHSTETVKGSTRTYTAQQDIYQGIAKLTWAVNKANRLTLSANGVYPISGGGGKFGIDTLTGQPLLGNEDAVNGQYNTIAHKYLGSSTNAQLKWSTELAGKRVMLDTWLGYHYETGGRLPADGSKLGSNSGQAGISNIWWHSRPYDLASFEKVPGDACGNGNAANNGAEAENIPCPVRNYHTGGSEFIEQQNMHRVQGRSILTYLFQGLGHHVMKAGIDSEYQLHNSERAYTGGIDYLDDYYPYVFLYGRAYGYLEGPDKPVIMSKLSNKAKSLSLGAFIQDSWSVMDEVTVNLGLRYDAQLLYNAQGELAMTLPKQWSPRAGLIWDWTHEGKSKLYGSWARYFENVPLRALDRYLSGEPGLQAAPFVAACDATDPAAQEGACLKPENLTTEVAVAPNTRYAPYSSGTSIIDPSLKAPSTDEFVFGTDYEVVRDGRLGLNYTNRRLNNTIEDMSRDDGTTYFFGNPGYGLARDIPKAQRKYDAVTVQFTKMFSQTWLAQGSYTASWLRGNYSGLYVPETLQADPHQNQDFDLAALRVNKYGYLPGDRRHSIKVFAAKGIEIPSAGVFTPGAAFRSNSGAPMSALGRYQEVYINAIDVLPRGEAGRLPWVHSIDLRLAYGYNFTKAAGLQLTFDVFNLLNFQQITARDPEYATNQVDPVTDGKGLSSVKASDGSPVQRNPNYGHATAFQAPRIFRFGVKGTF